MKVQFLITTTCIILLNTHTLGIAQENTRISTTSNISNEFAWKLFRWSKPRDEENFILSPLTVQLILSVMQFGAKGNTKMQILNVTNNVNPSQLYYILNPEGIAPEVKSASGIFIDTDERIDENVSGQIHKSGGNVYNIPLQHEPIRAKNIINSWASNATDGHISEFLNADADVSSLKALLASAIYFHSTWKFHLKPSSPRTFYTTPNHKKFTEFMEVTAYLKFKDFNLGNNVVGSMISLPYKENRYSMQLIVPVAELNLNTFLKGLDYVKFSDIIKNPDQLYQTKIKLFMPKFKASSKVSLVKPLQKMGLVDIFSQSKSLLTELFNSHEALLVSEILQESTLDVDELGTVATSVTGAFVVPLSASEPEARVIVIDKPFIAVIVETASQTPIFISKISNPSNGK